MGPLQGLRVIELAGIGPVPFAATLLADLGADVIKVDRVGAAAGWNPETSAREILHRSRRSLALDLKHAEGVEVLHRLLGSADVLLEGFRPGVMERLGLGPDAVTARHPRLIYARMTGWGQDGPLAPTAGHDIDYIGVAGVLGLMGPPGEPPLPPLNLVGDYGGGALYLVVGVLAALHERRRSGSGQVIDVAMVDGAASLTMLFRQLRAQGLWEGERGENLLDGGAPFYATYATADGKHVAVGALEPQFYTELLAGLGLDAAELPPQYDRNGWPDLRSRFAAAFATRTRDEWEAIFAGTDACVAPVLDLDEAVAHPHAAARGAFVEIAGVDHPAPAPRFSRTPAPPPRPAVPLGADTRQVLTEVGLDEATIAAFEAEGVVRAVAPPAE